ncbi:MAG TPA: hypothetical protein VFE50_16810 [Cyclobacteriaceae bacterium]|nr:hypothetical protein [Cyclobacteriaceae bacterium]
MSTRGIGSFKQLEPNRVVNDLYAYVGKELSGFTASDEFKENLTLKRNENHHSEILCLFLTSKCKSRFYFARETSQKGSSTVDIGVYLGTTLICTMEAKILPTPKGTRKRPRLEHEYVHGPGAGIQRYKDEKHGLDHRNKLFDNGSMIAYVKKHDFNHWHAKINEWIKDAGWASEESLEIIELGAIGHLKSRHKRVNKSFIDLRHFWVII